MIGEGYSADYRQQFGSADRTTILKSGIEVKLSEVPDYFNDKQAVADILSYYRWKKLGFPKADYEECDNRYIELVDCLKDYDDLYHPQKSTIF